MCKFCKKHAEKLMPKSRWYLNEECYSENLGKSQDRVKIFNQIIGYSLEYYFRYTNNVLRLQKIPLLSPIVRRYADFMAPRLHAGQIISLEDALKIVDLSTDHIALPCACRRYSGGYEEKTCLNFGVIRGLTEEADPNEDFSCLSRNEAKDLLRKWEEDGYYHQTLWAKQPYIIAICNCDARSCLPRKQRKHFDAPYALYKGHEVAIVNLELCNGCGTCLTRCPFEAIRLGKKATIDITKCFGCGLCSTTCPQQAITMVERQITPAKDLW